MMNTLNFKESILLTNCTSDRQHSLCRNIHKKTNDALLGKLGKRIKLDSTHSVQQSGASADHLAKKIHLSVLNCKII